MTDLYPTLYLLWDQYYFDQALPTLKDKAAAKIQRLSYPLRQMTYAMRDTLYPTDWPALARTVKEANHWCCQACGKQCRRPGEFYLGWEYELTVAHYDQEYDGEAVFVVALCIRCHLLHDAPHSWRARRRNAGQLTLSLR